MAHIPQFMQMFAQISHYQVGFPSISSYVYINLPFIIFNLFLKYGTLYVYLFICYVLFIHCLLLCKNANIQTCTHTNKYDMQVNIRHFVDLALGVHK